MEHPVAFNFRDVGPLLTDAGTRLREGVFYRSACPERTTPGLFVATIVENRIATVVDLRTDEEREGLGSAWERPKNVSFRAVPFLDSIRREWSHPDRVDAVSTAERYLEMIEASGPATRRIFTLLAEGTSTPILLHCAAGRDRTGMAYALILGALGVTVLEIARDYAKSHDAVTDGFGAHAQTMVELFRLIDAKHGSVVRLLQELGVPEEDVVRMRENYGR